MKSGKEPAQPLSSPDSAGEKTVVVVQSRGPRRFRITLTGIAILLVGAGVLFHTQYSNWRVLRAEREVRKFEELVGRLLTENRRAQFKVTDQYRQGDKWESTLLWLEFDGEGKPLCEREFKLVGREVFVDAVRVQYEYEALKVQEHHNFALFRRIFTDEMRPRDGIPLYPVSLQGVDRKATEGLSEKEKLAFRRQLDLLKNYLVDPEYARKHKVRTIEGEAKYTLLEPGYLYTVSQTSTGGFILDRKKTAAVPNPPAPNAI